MSYIHNSTLRPGGPIRKRSAKRVQQDKAYKPIHDAVIERDGGCVIPNHPYFLKDGSPMFQVWPEVRCGGSLIVHHVISRARAPELALDPDNLLTLCWDHHVAVHANVALATERGLLKSAPLLSPQPTQGKK